MKTYLSASTGPFGVLELFHRHPTPPARASELTLSRPPLPLVIELVAAWHSTLPHLSISSVLRSPPVMTFGAEYLGWLYAVAVWSAPIALHQNDGETLELRRLAVCAGAPHCTASWMLGAMASVIRRECPEIHRLLTYQDTEVHSGTIYRAAGWSPAGLTQARSWNNPTAGRPRPNALPAKRRLRWELRLPRQRA